MAQAKRDQNYHPTLIAVDATGAIYPLEIDTSSGRLLIEIALVSSTTPSLPENAVRDNNQVPTLLAETDDGNRTPTPVLVDNRNGYLWADVNVE